MIDIENAVIENFGDPQGRAASFREHLPRDDVGVVFHRRKDDLVAAADFLFAPGSRHEVDRFGRVSNEDHLSGIRGADETRDLLSDGFETEGGLR